MNLRSRLDSLELEASHGTLGDRGPLLQVLEHQLASRGPHLLNSVGLGVVRQPASVGDSLHHLGAPLPSEKNLNRLVQEGNLHVANCLNGHDTLLQQMTKTITEKRRFPFYLLDLATRSSSSFFLIA